MLPGWVRWVIAGACVTTLLIAALGTHLLWDNEPIAGRMDSLWFRNGLAILAAFWIATSCAPAWRLPRVLRVALLLPALHLIVIVVGWRMWQVASLQLHEAVRMGPLVAELSPVRIAPWLALGCVATGVLVARRRREILDAIAMTALAQLLLVGLWLPIAAVGLGKRLGWTEYGVFVDGADQMIAIVLAPPLVCAIAFAAVASRAPGWLAVRRHWLTGVLGILVVAAIACRLAGSSEAYLVYGNFVPLLLGSAVVALAALLALIAGSWRLAPRPRGRISGTITGGGDAIGAFEIAGWLRGPRAIVSPFTLVTPDGDVPVPGGAALLAPVPVATTQLRTGESIPVLRAGDRVTVDGFVTPHDGGAPFRASLAPVPGPRGLAVAPLPAEPGDFGHVALSAWRPCVAYFLILIAIGVPALAALIAA